MANKKTNLVVAVLFLILSGIIATENLILGLSVAVIPITFGIWQLTKKQ